MAHTVLQHGTGWNITGQFYFDQGQISDQLDAGGLAALAFAAGSKGTVSDTTFDNPGRPIAMAEDVDASFTALQFAAGHLARSIYVSGGSWTQDHTWTNADVPYEIASFLVFGAGTTQAFEAGVVFKMAEAAGLNFDDLEVLATVPTPTVFTSIDDDEFGGDTYGDGPGKPAPGDYPTIGVNGTALILGGWFRYGDGLKVEGHADIALTFFEELLGADGYLAALYFGGGSSGSVADSWFEEVARPLRLGTDADVTLSNLSMSPTTAHSIFVEGGVWSHSRTWTNEGLPYELGGSGFSFATPSTQIVEPGVVFKLQLGVSLDFDELTVNGMAGQPVVFTTVADDEYGGDTYVDGLQPTGGGDYPFIGIDGTTSVEHAIFRFGSGIQVNTHADFDHVTVEFQDVTACPTAAIEFDGLTTGSVVDSHFRDTCLPVKLLGGADPTLSGLTAESQSFAEAVWLQGNVWSIARTWSDPGLPYLCSSDLTLPPGNTIAPGVVFKTEPGVAVIELDDSIQGTPDQPIVFTSFLDDSVAGDTNVDGPSVAAPGDWGGVRIYGGGEWSHLQVQYAQLGVEVLTAPSGSIRNGVFRYNGTGLRLAVFDFIPWTVTDTQFVSNGTGVRVLDPNFATLGNVSDGDTTNDGRNLFACNVINAENESFSTDVLAENNWWGAAPPVAALFVGGFDTVPFLPDSRSGALTLLRVDRSGASDIALSWDDVAPACGYRVLRSTLPVSGFVDLSGPMSGAVFLDVGAAASPDIGYYLVSIE